MPKTHDMPRVAIFMEYGLHEGLLSAQWSGDTGRRLLKAAADQSMPVVGIGLLWRRGYTTQLINADSHPYDVFPVYAYDFYMTRSKVAKNSGRERMSYGWWINLLIPYVARS